MYSSLASISALWVINNCTTSVLLLRAARCRGVLLYSSLASISALWVINNCAISVPLLEAAECRNVRLYFSRLPTSGEKPSKRSRPTISTSPVSTARSKSWLGCSKYEKHENTNIKTGEILVVISIFAFSSCTHLNFKSKLISVLSITSDLNNTVDQCNNKYRLKRRKTNE